ncbi:MAG: Sir2 family NAD-dependent protein deacetylase [Candidatus Sericytochromatia bacterium]|nr:Sir2 family NAD-dependent protein deacetylase [Candidatus Sericytochromatia bacterium]
MVSKKTVPPKAAPLREVASDAYVARQLDAELQTLAATADAALAEPARPGGPGRRPRARREVPPSLGRLQQALRDNLAQAIPARGLTTLDIARATGMSRTTLHALQEGTLDPQLSTLASVAGVLGVSPTLLLLDHADWRAILASVIELLPELLSARPGSPSELPRTPDDVRTQLRGRASRKDAAGQLPARVAQQLLHGGEAGPMWTRVLAEAGARRTEAAGGRLAPGPEDTVQVGLALGQHQLGSLGLLIGGNMALGMARPDLPAGDLQTLVRWLREAAGQAVVIAGAGLAAEAGLQPYRGAEGLLLDAEADVLTTLAGLEAHPEAFVQHYRERARQARALREEGRVPQSADALRRLQQAGLVGPVLAASPDGLLAGVGVTTTALFGTYDRFRCHRCQAPASWEAFLDPAGTRPTCPAPGCGGLLRPDLVLRNEPPGEALEATWRTLEDQVRATPLVLVVGSSLRDRRVARFALLARMHGARLALVDPAPTHLFDDLVHWRLQAPASTALLALCAVAGV